MKKSIKYILLAVVAMGILWWAFSSGSSKTNVKIYGVIKKIDDKSFTIYGIRNSNGQNSGSVLMEVSMNDGTVVSKRYSIANTNNFTEERVNKETFKNDLNKGVVMVAVDVQGPHFPFYKNQANVISYSGPGIVK